MAAINWYLFYLGSASKIKECCLNEVPIIPETRTTTKSLGGLGLQIWDGHQEPELLKEKRRWEGKASSSCSSNPDLMHRIPSKFVASFSLGQNSVRFDILRSTYTWVHHFARRSERLVHLLRFHAIWFKLEFFAVSYMSVKAVIIPVVIDHFGQYWRYFNFRRIVDQ